MMNNNKILTVSYGTFSCTLEGFEDSFGTMKVIAEYFRDLAADDRYFGAEPPQPDADLMARIAEQDLARRVEAREQDGRIVLSAMDATAVAGHAVIAADAPEARAAVPPEAVEETAEEVSLDADAEEIEDDAAVAVEELAEEAVDAVTTEDLEEAIQDDAPSIEIAAVESPSEEDSSAEVIEETEAAEDEDVTAAEKEDPAQDDEDVTQEEISEVEAEIIEEVAAEDEEDEVAEEVSSEDDHDEVAADASAEDDHDEVEIVPGQADADVSAFFADADASPEDDADSAEDMMEVPVAPVAEDPEPNSIAAKLQRIRAVVAKNETAKADYLEDEHAETEPAEDTVAETAFEMDEDDVHADVDAAAEEDVTQDADEPLGAVAEDVDYAETEEAEAAPEVIADALADIEGALDADDAQEILSDMSEEATDEDDALDAALEQLDAITAEAEAQDDKSLEEALEDAVQGETAEDSVANLFDSENIAEAPRRKSRIKTTILEPIDPAEAAAAEPVTKSRIVKVKRADLEAAIEKNAREQEERARERAEIDSVTEDPVEAATETEVVAELNNEVEESVEETAPASSLSPEDEDDLARELAAVAKDVADGDATASDAEEAFPTLDKDADADAAAQPERKVSSRGLLPSLEEEGRGSAVSRLLAETDHQMDEPEGANRRDAFAQLRAAVAAKKADSSIENADKESDSPYREDLAEVVRPRQKTGEPQPEAAAASPKEEARPAPLKLVAEQRIDAEAEAEDNVAEEAVAEDTTEAAAPAPVAPRRVVSTPLEPQTATAGSDEFVKFANEMGANSLSQLLEAAAAYMTFVEGREQFSRPQLMTKVRQAEGPDGFSREDGLRSFGQLLRAGKIEKLKGGRFTVSEDIGFRPDHRAAG